MSQRFRSRAVRAVALVLACAAGAAGTSFAGSALTRTDTAVIQACEQKASGLVRIVPSSARCTRSEIPISWNQAGPAGPPGPAGPAGQDGADGKDGASVTVATLAAGEGGCVGGGARISAANGDAVVCNGTNGKDGGDGKDGTSLASLDSLQGAACTTQSGDQGTVAVAVGADGTVTLHCASAESQAAPVLTALSVPSQLFRGVPYTGHVTLSRDVTSDTAIALGGPSLLGLPASVTVPAGADSARFDYTPTDTGSGTVTATLGGASISTAVDVVELPPSSPVDIPALAGIAAPASLAPGSDGYVTVSLAGVAPPGGTTVELAATSGTVDATVTVPAGTASADARIEAPFSGSQIVVTATLGATALSAEIRIG